MPSGKIKIGNRDHIITKEFYKKFLEKHPDIDITWKDFVLIIRESNKEIARIATTEQNGIKLPEGHGYLVISSFNSKNKAIDAINSYKYGKTIYHLNLHSLGKKVSIRWFNNNSFSYYPRIYRFAGCRTFKRQVSKSAKEGFMYLQWDSKDFIKFDKIMKVQTSKRKLKWE